MIIDTSAVVAIFRDEPEGPTCLEAIEQASTRLLSAATLLEVSIVVLRKREHFTLEDLDRFLADYTIVIEPLTESQARVARLAYRQYGRGMDHPARLNFGDCFAYALARERNEPLLFTGDDFTHTDIRPALAP